MAVAHLRPLSELKRGGLEQLANLRDTSVANSRAAGEQLIANARAYGLDLRDYLTLAVDPRLSTDDKVRNQYSAANLNGYEASLAYLGLPVRDDFENGITLQAASETFQTFPGVRAMFPEVIDDMVQWKYRQTNFETIAPLISQSRTINGVEMITTVVDDKAGDYQHAQAIAEGSRIPVRSLRMEDFKVGIFKHGMGYRTTYEFERRARLDILTPYVLRAQRELDRSKVAFATDLLVNGDGTTAHGAAPVVAQSSYNTAVGTNATSGKISYLHLLNWLVARAKAGTPVDTVVGNWDAYIQWLMMFAIPTSSNNRTDAENLAAAGFQMGGVPVLTGVVNFALSSTAPANTLIGYSRGDTMEELIEAGSLIDESERSVGNQTITYYRTQNSGFRLAFGDTRSIYNYGG